MSNDQIILSVIIPVYNSEDTIGEVLESILGQSLKACEVICVDDGSTDRSVDVIREYIAKDSRVSLIRQENQYAGVARNKGIDAAKGEYLFFLDADDFVLNYALEAVCDKARRNKLDCLKFMSLTYDEKNRRYVDKKRNSGGYLQPGDYGRLLKTEADSPLLKISVAPWSGIYRTEFVRKEKCRFNNLRCVNDRSFYSKVITCAERIMIARDRVTVHRVNQDNSLVGKKSYHFDCQIDSILLTEKQLVSDGVSPELTELIMKQEYQDLMAWYRRFAVDPERKAEMDRQIEGFLEGRTAPYDVILLDLIKYSESIPAGNPQDEEVKPVHERAEHPAVTVLVPITEESNYPDEFLSRLTNQTPEEMEFLLLDTGVTEQNRTILREYAEVDHRFIIAEMPGAGYGQSLNNGLEMARGEYIAITDPEDFAEPGFFELLYREAAAQNLDQIRADFSTFRINNTGVMETHEQKQASGPHLYNRVMNPAKNRELFSVPDEARSVLYRRGLLKDAGIRFNEGTGASLCMAGFQFRTLCCTTRMMLISKGQYMERIPDWFRLKADSLNQRNVTDEFSLIHQWISEDGKRKATFEGILYSKELNCMLKTLDRMETEEKIPYMKQIQETMKAAQAQQPNCRNMTGKTDRERLEEIMESPERAMEKTDISVIIPVYNAGEYLEECLGSILEGSKSNIEVICVDDGSTDESSEILKRFAEKDHRVRVYRTENRGAGAARNEGLKHAKGEYCSFLDADDLFEREMLSRAWEKAEAEQLDLVVFASDNFYSENGKTSGSQGIAKEWLPEKRPFAGTDIEKNLFRTFIGWAWDKLFRTSFIREKGLKFAELRTSNDLSFVFAGIAAAERINVLDDQPLAHHRRYPGSISRNRDENWRCYYDALKELRENLERLGLYQRFERDFINYALYFSIWQMTSIGSEGYRKIFGKLNEEWLDNLGITGKGEGYFYDPAEYELLTQIRQNDPDGFLLFSLERTRKQLSEKEAMTADADLPILHSASYRIGRAVTWLPRKARGGSRRIIQYGIRLIGTRREQT